MSLIKKDNDADMDYIKNTCKIGQGKECCRYLTIGSKGFECARENELKQMIDSRVNTMNAQGDNCKGYTKRIETN